MGWPRPAVESRRGTGHRCRRPEIVCRDRPEGFVRFQQGRGDQAGRGEGLARERSTPPLELPARPAGPRFKNCVRSRLLAGQGALSHQGGGGDGRGRHLGGGEGGRRVGPARGQGH